MTEQNLGVISFIGYRLAHFEYNCDPGFELNSIENGLLKFNFSKMTRSRDDGETQINLLTNVFYSNDDCIEKAPMRIVVEIAGIFKTQNKQPWDSKWESNAIAILFPYVRAIIGTLTAQSGREPVILPTINVAALFERKTKENSN